MLAMLAYVMGLVMLQFSRIDRTDVQQHPVSAAMADGLMYYQSAAIQQCLDTQTQTITCPAGVITMTGRPGSGGAMQYGRSFISVTDGSTYIMTTLASSAATMMDTTQYADIVGALNDQTEQSVTIGIYRPSVGGVYLGNWGGRVVTVTFPTTPTQGQPVIYQPIHS